MFKINAMLLVTLLLSTSATALAVPDQAPESVTVLQRKLEIAEAKGDINQRQALKLRGKLNALVKELQAAAKPATAVQTRQFDAKVQALASEIEHEKHARKVAGRFWSNWF